MQFHENLRLAREQMGWTQAELAERTRFKPSAISHFERGVRNPSIGNLLRLADALDASVDSLMGRDTKWTRLHDVQRAALALFDGAKLSPMHRSPSPEKWMALAMSLQLVPANIPNDEEIITYADGSMTIIYKCPCGGEMLPWHGHNTTSEESRRCVKCGLIE